MQAEIEMEIDDQSIDYMKERYNEAVDRFKSMEDKGIKIMTALSFVMAVLTAVATKKNIIEFEMPIDWVLSVLVFIDLICIFWAWLHALLALKVEEAPVPNRSVEVQTYLVQEPQKHTRHAILNFYADTTRELEKVTDEKAKYVEHSYNELRLAGFISMACFIVYTFKDL